MITGPAEMRKVLEPLAEICGVNYVDLPSNLNLNLNLSPPLTNGITQENFFNSQLKSLFVDQKFPGQNTKFSTTVNQKVSNFSPKTFKNSKF